MSLLLFNTLNRGLERFEPIEPPTVRMYTCGPTVYDFNHIGNFRAYVFEDLLRRHLELSGYDVFHVMNLTDVDDKTIRASRESDTPLSTYTQTYKDAFFEDVSSLNLVPAHRYPAATEHVPEMIDLIERLFERGFAYSSEDGSVYFSIQKFPEYGKLAHLDPSGLRPGARVAQDEYEKDQVCDFALWKAWTPEDGDVGWDSPWGRGRPGWHIECSAMSMKYLGESFDIHCGGIDNMFPHHEDEIAQSEGATGRPFVRYWLHNAHLVVDGKKMSKSLGNFFTVRDLLGRGYRGRDIRFALMTSAHYRQTLNFTMHGLEGARTALARLDEFAARVESVASGHDPGAPRPEWIESFVSDFRRALDDDLNISAAMAGVFDFVRDGNRALDDGAMRPEDADAVLDAWRHVDRVLGFLVAPEEDAGSDILELVHRRQTARDARDWSESDRLRDEILRRGWNVQDTPSGAKVKKA